MAKTVEEVIGSSENEFKKVLEVVRDELNAKKIKVRASTSGAISLNVDQVSWSERLKSKGIDVESANRILQEQISVMMNLILNENESRAFSHFFGGEEEIEQRDENFKSELKAKIKTRIDSVRAILNDQIRWKYLLRVTTKENIPRLVDWEVRSKSHDARRGNIGIPPYICLRIEYFKMAPEMSGRLYADDDTWNIFGSHNSLREVATFELDADDLGEIIAILENAKSKLLEGAGQP